MNLRRGSLYRVEFVDHIEGGHSLPAFVVYGRLVSVTRSAIRIEVWGYANAKHKRDHNCDSYTIIRSAIKRVTQLVATKEE